jgi:hypothetical protein
VELTDLEQLDRELGLEDDPLDELDELDFLADAELAAAEFADAVAKVDISDFSRRDNHRIKERLRQHPDVIDILAGWKQGGSDAAALRALEALVKGWSVIPSPDGPKAVSVALEAVESQLGRCAWPGCEKPRKQRQGGTTGRQPKHCHKHTFEAKRKADRERLRAKRGGTLKVPGCCREWTRSGHRGKCQQHRDYEAASRPEYPLSAIEAAYLGTDGFHIV